MNTLDRLLQTRKNFIRLIEGLSTENLNTIPAGFNNNIIWNFAHTLASQQILCYKLAQLPMLLDDDFINSYKKGSKPEGIVSDTMIKEWSEKALSLVDQTSVDLRASKFNAYQPYHTSYGIAINTIEEALEFVNMHEALHLGYAMALRKALENKH